jgi:hypothetical protein
MRTYKVLVFGAFGYAAVLSGLLVLLPVVGVAQQDPAVGTWKLNLTKSTFSPGPPPKSAILTIEAAGQGLRVTANTTGADGTTITIRYTANRDGKDYRVTGSPDYDTVALTGNQSTVQGTRKKGGKVVQTYTRVLSADGKTMTVTSTGINASERKINNVAVYEKQ